jgi:hypothetical protein
MATLMRRKPKLSFQQVLRAVQELPPNEQRRLRDELAKSAGVHLIRPTGDAAAIRRGRRLANTIRAELTATATESLDDAMACLRGPSWLS